MTISRWKVLAGVLGVSVGGLAVCAEEHKFSTLGRQAQPAPVSASPSICPIMPSCPASPVADFNPSYPVVVEQAHVPPTVIVPVVAAQPLAVETMPAPTELTETKALQPTFVVPMAVEPPPAIATPAPAVSKIPPPPPPVAVPVVESVKPVEPPPQMTYPEVVATPPAVAVPSAPAQPVEFREERVIESKPTPPVASVKPTEAGPWKLYVKLSNGSPRFEVRNQDEILLKGTCERIDMQSAAGGCTGYAGLTASGRVRVSGPGVEATCDEVSVQSLTGEVVLRGNVRMTARNKGKQQTDVAADVLTFRLTPAGLSVAVGTTSASR